MPVVFNNGPNAAGVPYTSPAIHDGFLILKTATAVEGESDIITTNYEQTYSEIQYGTFEEPVLLKCSEDRAPIL